MIDEEGYRLNVGMVLVNGEGRLFWGRRMGQDAWQFPQGGVKAGETPQETVYRELYEELGLKREDVTLLGCTAGWLRYRLPRHLIRYYSLPLCIGQKQKWYLLRLEGSDQKIRLDLSSQPEFDSWRWVDYWYPLQQVIAFKRQVYKKALQEFEGILMTSKKEDDALEAAAV